MIACIVPDCEFVVSLESTNATSGVTTEMPERAKRIVVDHINNDHAEAHVICACAHDWQEPESLTLHTVSGDTGAPVEVQVVREQCTRCLQYQQRDPDTADQPPKGDEGVDGEA